MVRFYDFKQRLCPTTLNGLANPRRLKEDVWEFPKGTVFHFTPDNGGSIVGIQKLPMFAKAQRVEVYQITDLSKNYGTVTNKAGVTDGTLFQELNSDLKKPFIRGRSLGKSISQPAVVTLLDYSKLEAKYRYPLLEAENPRPLEYVYRSQNHLDSVIEQINLIDADHQIVSLSLPETSFSLGDLRYVAKDIATSQANKWTSLSALWVREVAHAIADEEHRLRKIKSEVLLLVSFPGGYTAVSLKDIFEWTDGSSVQQATSLWLTFVNRCIELTRLTDNQTIEELDEDTVQSLVNKDMDAIAPTTSPIQQMALARAQAGLMSKAAYDRIERISNDWKTVKSPSGEEPLEEYLNPPNEFIKLNVNALSLPDNPTLIEQSLRGNNLAEYHAKYIENKVLERDLISTVQSFENVGYMLVDVKSDPKVTAIDDYTRYTFKMVGIDGKSVSLPVDIPNVDREGEFTAGNVAYRMGIQKADEPIRKVFGYEVALTSYFGKAFIRRSRLSAFSLASWYSRKITTAALDQSNNTITSPRFTQESLPKNVPLPRVYTAIAEHISHFTSKGIEFNFNWININNERPDAVKYALSHGIYLCGKDSVGVLYGLADAGNLYSLHDGTLKNLGPLHTYLDPSWGKPPEEFVGLSLFKREVPIAYVLSYAFTLDDVLNHYTNKKGIYGVLDYLGVTHRWVDKGSRLDLTEDEAVIRFKSETLVYNKEDPKIGLVMAGFNRYANSIKKIEPADLSRYTTYMEILGENNVKPNVLKEIKLMLQLFIDPITKRELRLMKEPEEIIPLFKRSVELLTNDEHTDEMDPSLMRYRGYERFAGLMYQEMIKSYKEHDRNSNVPLSMKPRAVWKSIQEDSSVMLVEESGPVHNVKEQSTASYSGTFGRSIKTMVPRTRAFHKNDVGVVSEASPDSAKTGVRFYLTPNAKLTSVYGNTERFDFEKDGVSSAVSISSLLQPGTMNMDSKRANLASVQQSSITSVVGGQILPVRTGEETMIAHRTSDKFAKMASQDGEVIKVTDREIKIRYEDGTVESYNLGRKHGKAAGAVIPHTLSTDLKKGDSFKKGDAIRWNSDYFVRDSLNPNGVSYKGGVLATIAFRDASDSLEDGSTATRRLAEKLATPITYTETVIVEFPYEIRDMVDVGDALTPDDTLVVIEDAIIAQQEREGGNYGLSEILRQTPKANSKGTISGIECLYLGDKEEMSASLRNFVEASDRERAKGAGIYGNSKAKTGEVADNIFVNGKRLITNSVAITFYITKLIGAGIGDKAIYDNPLKSILGRIANNDIHTESGVEVDAECAWNMVDNRIIYVQRVGMLNRIAMKLTSNLVDIWNS